MINLKNYKFNRLYDLKVDKTNSVEFEELEKGKKISILSDTMLKAMFQNENRIKYSAKFLSYFIDVDYEKILKNIYLSKNELNKEKEFDKGERCDYVAYLDDTLLNIEVNNNSSLKTLERNIDYAHRLYATKVKKGDKEYEYTQTIQFNLNNFAFLGNDKIIDIYAIQNNDELMISDKLIFVQIYVPNLRKKWYNEGIESLSEAERYILALTEMDIEKLKEFGDDLVMKEYIKEAEEVSFESGIGEAYDKEWALKDEGIREGIKQGTITKAREIAKAMLEDNIDIETISKYTNLSIKEIESLK